MSRWRKLYRGRAAVEREFGRPRVGNMDDLDGLNVTFKGEGVYFASRQYEAIKKLAAKTPGSLSIEQRDDGSVLVTTPTAWIFSICGTAALTSASFARPS